MFVLTNVSKLSSQVEEIVQDISLVKVSLYNTLERRTLNWVVDSDFNLPVVILEPPATKPLEFLRVWGLGNGG